MRCFVSRSQFHSRRDLMRQAKTFEINLVVFNIRTEDYYKYAKSNGSLKSHKNFLNEY